MSGGYEVEMGLLRGFLENTQRHLDEFDAAVGPLKGRSKPFFGNPEALYEVRRLGELYDAGPVPLIDLLGRTLKGGRALLAGIDAMHKEYDRANVNLADVLAVATRMHDSFDASLNPSQQPDPAPPIPGTPQ